MEIELYLNCGLWDTPLFEEVGSGIYPLQLVWVYRAPPLQCSATQEEVQEACNQSKIAPYHAAFIIVGPREVSSEGEQIMERVPLYKQNQIPIILIVQGGNEMTDVQHTQADSLGSNLYME